MNSGTYDWVEAMMAIEAKRLAAQPKKTKKGKGEVMTYKKVIDAIGGGVMRAAARRLGISHNTVYGWSRKGMVPKCRVDQVREAAKKMGVKIDG
jgi:hypothetical protein